MISREPTIERLAAARALLLEPFGLDEARLAAALAEIASHRVDDADLYFQYTRSEGWSLEEGIVKSGTGYVSHGYLTSWPGEVVGATASAKMHSLGRSGWL